MHINFIFFVLKLNSTLYFYIAEISYLRLLLLEMPVEEKYLVEHYYLNHDQHQQMDSL